MRQRNFKLRLRYGITLAQYEHLAAQQRFCCAICEKQPRRVNLAVDHSHATQTVRGLVCWGCNQWVEKFAFYLERAASEAWQGLVLSWISFEETGEVLAGN
jgi:hypothetical protein